MEVQERRLGDVVILAITGDITMSEGGAMLLAERVRGVLQQGHDRIVLDLGQVRYVDSSGLGELVQANAAARNRGASITLVNVTRRLQDLFVLTKLLPVFEIFEREADAIASVDAAGSSRLLRYARRR